MLLLLLLLFSGIQGVQGEGESDSVEVVGEWPRVGDSTGTLVWIWMASGLIKPMSELLLVLFPSALFVFVAPSRASRVSPSLAVNVVKLDMISSSERPHVADWL